MNKLYSFLLFCIFGLPIYSIAQPCTHTFVDGSVTWSSLLGNASAWDQDCVDTNFPQDDVDFFNGNVIIETLDGNDAIVFDVNYTIEGDLTIRTQSNDAKFIVNSGVTLNVENLFFENPGSQPANNTNIEINGNVNVTFNFSTGNNNRFSVPGQLFVGENIILGNNNTCESTCNIIYGVACVSGNNDFCEDHAVLPIELSAFSGKMTENQTVLLIWKTDTEQNNATFTIERSLDGYAYQSIGELPGTGNNKTPQQYQFTDFHPLPGNNYYRLKQTDFDGAFSYSPVITVHRNLDISQATIYPNPGASELTLVAKNLTQSDISVQLLSITGKVYLRQQLQTKDAYITRKLNTSTLPRGVYFVKVQQDQHLFLQKIVLQ
ncbi:T9SS type A sorting domain-containing protein [Rapidithrix thailandica]|uniref:T9SS type A sorting domain-containing protein n=1 Tax=Rapidithrix thailandica TaxID=413964 RepID=A0AAW9S7N6_9BACT